VSARDGAQPDGFRWSRGLVSGAGAWTLVDPNGHHVAHVTRSKDHTYAAVTASGVLLVDGVITADAAMRAVDNEVRPCAHTHVEASRVVVHCDNDREPGSMFCAEHQHAAAA
jgi:hypothetical protein